MSTNAPITTQYHNLVAYPPNSDSTTPHQWLHQGCEGNLEIGNDGTISCQKCEVKQPALNWYITDETHMAEAPPEAKQLDFTTVSSLAGQIASTAGPKWLGEFLSNIEE